MFHRTETKVNPTPIERKTHTSQHVTSFAEFLSNGGNHDLSNIAAIRMYMDAMPFYAAVDIRARNFAQIPMRVWDTKAKVFVDDHESMELLKKPNADVTGSEFLEQYASFFDITGDSFLFASGRAANPPLELATVAPYNITFGTGQRFGILHVPDTITTTDSIAGGTRFVAKDVDGMIRFQSGLEESQELWHTRKFNPLRSGTNFFGMSTARPVFLEIQQYLSGNNNNWSILKRGARVSMAWVNNKLEPLTDGQWDRMIEEKAKYEGDLNAGGAPILDGVDIKSISMSNVDMQFKDLQDAMLARILSVYGIPLALFMDKSMTLNNLEVSMVQLFDNAVLPLTRYLYAELTQFILMRYKNSENLEYRFNADDIEALQVRIIESAKKKSEVNVSTMDELRAMLGGEDLPNGDGSVILAPKGTAPLNFDPVIEPPAVSSKFFELMQEVKNDDGTRRYSDDEIKTISDDRGL
jgi:HK97 family phage portal protein